MPARDEQQHPSHVRRPLVEPPSPHLNRDGIDALLTATGRGDLGAFGLF